MNKKETKQMKFMYINLDALVPNDHFLRKLSSKIDFSFIYDKVSDLYSEKGRPSVDPELLIKSILIGFLYGIDSERKLEQEIKVNMAFKWFLGLDIDENPPDHSTMSQNRRRRFNDSNVFREIFEEIIIKCYEAGLIDGKIILTDSTHVKANASNKNYEVIEVKRKFNDYVTELDKLADLEIQKLKENGINVNPKSPKPKILSKKISITDPECGELNRPNKPRGFHYLNHASSDPKHGIIVDVEVTGAEASDVSVYMDRLKYITKRFNFTIEDAVADSGYNRAIIHYLLQNENINLYTPKIKEKPQSKYNLYSRKDMIYDELCDSFSCPNDCILNYIGITVTKMEKFINYIKQKIVTVSIAL